MDDDSNQSDRLERLEMMLLIRRFEEKAAEVYGEGKIRGFLHLYIGEEAVAVGAMGALEAGDNVVATYREHGHAIARGMSPESIMAEMYGKVSGCSLGRGGSMHLFSKEHRFFGGHAIVGGGLPVAVGLALADKLRGRSATTACFFGDGATDEGEFHEALNLAALWKLPVLFLCENNSYAMGTAIARHASNVELCHKPIAYGIPAEKIDGMDVLAVDRAVRYASTLVREGEGPRFLELVTYRFRAHSMYDAELYREKSEVEAWRARDPIELLKSRLVSAGEVDEKGFREIDDRVRAKVEEACRFADEAPLESVSELERHVLAPEAVHS